VLRDVLWPVFEVSSILYEDDDLIVIDKPVGVPTHAPDRGRQDDAVSRLRSFIAERDRKSSDEVYLGIHHRLDRDTSGVLLLTKRRTANAGVAAQFEGRTVHKTYVAAAVRWPRGRERGVLRDWVCPCGPGGRMQAVGQPRFGRARADLQQAVTRFRVVARRGQRTLLELVPETGRTHQLRVQIASAGAAIAGDTLYGDEPAPRLLLHARAISLEQPATREPLRIEAPVPVEIDEWMTGKTVDPLGDVGVLERVLRAAIAARWNVAHAPDETTALRLFHGDGEGLEGCAIDLYGEHALVHAFSDRVAEARPAIVDALSNIGVRGVYFMRHPKDKSTLVNPHDDELAPPHAVWGEDAPEPLIVLENGLRYSVRLGHGLKTGLFLDQRENRRRVRQLAGGKRVLNLFAYTCGFTVAAAAGGAAATTSVDTAQGVLAWGAENLVLNGLAGDAHAFVDDDALLWIRKAAKSAARYDLVILDPPSYATTHTSRFAADTDYPKLAASALGLLARGGMLLACTNHGKITWSRFRRHLHEAGRIAKRQLAQVKDMPEPSDFPPPYGSPSHLKSVLVTVA
jgi:23S rRNA (cytosine1962-C5)-methyltransferase